MLDFATSLAVQAAVVLLSSAILLLIWNLLKSRIDFPLPASRLFGMFVAAAILALLALPDVLQRSLMAADLIATALIIAGLRALMEPLDRSLNGSQQPPIKPQAGTPRAGAPERGGGPPDSPGHMTTQGRETPARNVTAPAGLIPNIKTQQDVGMHEPPYKPSPTFAPPPPSPRDAETEHLYDYDRLLILTHDKGVAERLIDYERQRAPNAGRKEWIERAIEHLHHDRRT